MKVRCLNVQIFIKINISTTTKFVYFNIFLSHNIFSIGLFLFLQVIAPLHVTMVKLRHYIIIGWGKYFIGMILMSTCIEEYKDEFIESKYSCFKIQYFYTIRIHSFLVSSSSCGSRFALGDSKLPSIVVLNR